MKSKVSGGILVTLGFLLSPLSWWNDLILNIPLAYGFAYLCSLISQSLFTPSMIVGYWLTNIIGFILMHKGTKKIINNKINNYSQKDLLKDILISIFYTLIVIFLIKIGWLKSPAGF